MKKLVITTALLIVIILTACASESVEVTRLVEVEIENRVEVTRLVEIPVEVTRVVEKVVVVTPTILPLTSTPRPANTPKPTTDLLEDANQKLPTCISELVSLTDNVTDVLDLVAEYSATMDYSQWKLMEETFIDFVVTSNEMPCEGPYQFIKDDFSIILFTYSSSMASAAEGDIDTAVYLIELGTSLTNDLAIKTELILNN